MTCQQPATIKIIRYISYGYLCTFLLFLYSIAWPQCFFFMKSRYRGCLFNVLFLVFLCVFLLTDLIYALIFSSSILGMAFHPYHRYLSLCIREQALPWWPRRILDLTCVPPLPPPSPFSPWLYNMFARAVLRLGNCRLVIVFLRFRIFTTMINSNHNRCSLQCRFGSVGGVRWRANLLPPLPPHLFHHTTDMVVRGEQGKSYAWTYFHVYFYISR